MLLGIAAVLGIVWLLGFTVFHVASGMLHLLIVVAVALAIWHFVANRTGRMRTHGV